MMYILYIGMLIAIVLLARWVYRMVFYSVNIKESHLGGEVIIYKKTEGNYQDAFSIMNDLRYKLLTTFYIQTTKGIVIYYDEPNKLEKGKFHLDVGCIIDISNIDDIKMAKINQTWKVKALPIMPSVNMEAPFYGRHSIIINMIKTRTKVERYMSSRGYRKGPIIETYDIYAKKMTYRQCLGEYYLIEPIMDINNIK
ncbi:hypothetical protein [Klebsiella oxytoca]|uniref:hypothetical protein n=1 Tax=Klebsiella oxytoca TaxID=571 RepID=UPI0034D24315